MTSRINPTDLDITYPVAGQDNDTQGFRDNFSNIYNNFLIAASEISALQANVSVAPLITAVPLNSTAQGTVGQIAFTTTSPFYLYVCVAPNKWVRTTLSTW